MRTIGVVTTARADYSIYRPVLSAITNTSDLHLQLIVAGMHLSPEFGMTVRDIKADGFTVAERIEMLLSSDSPEGIAKSVGLGIISYAHIFARTPPDILMLLGDRFEMYAAAVASLPFTLPIAHLHGGESTEGLIDEPIRHSLTKMSHLHFASTEPYRHRIIQMGEEPWRVTVSGAPALDNLRTLKFLPRAELEPYIGMALDPPPLLVTVHPVTLEYTDTHHHIEEVLTALDAVSEPVVFTYPNADTAGRVIIQAIDHFVANHSYARAVVNLGTEAYFSLMNYAQAMVGNSSSGIIEAASFALPVVNIGNRQRGRIHSSNVLNTPYDHTAIEQCIRQALAPTFRKELVGMQNPYGDGHAAERIVQVLQTIPLDNLLHKRFHNISFEGDQ